MKTKILFSIQDLGGGGAEKVLCNLVNHMDNKRFDITVAAVKRLLDSLELTRHYKTEGNRSSARFSTKETVEKTQAFLLSYKRKV